MNSFYNLSIFLLSITLVSFIGCETEDDNDNSNPMGYNCLNNNCVAQEGGQYLTLDDCLTICNNNQINSWNCVNSSCVEDSNGNGIYNTLSDCKNECHNNQSSWNCINSECVEDLNGNGIYNALSDCKDACNNSENCNNNFEVGSEGPYDISGLSELINFGNFYNSSTVNYEMRLFSENINAVGAGTYTGTGNMIYLNLHTNGQVAGNYSYNNNGWNPTVNTFDGGYFTNQNMYDYSMGMIFPTSINSGTVEIIDNGNYNFDVIIELNSSGTTISGCFSGQVTPYSGGSGSGGSGSSGSSSVIQINQNNINPKRF